MYVYMYYFSILTRMHEDMLFYEGECVTHWEIQVFQGELVFSRN